MKRNTKTILFSLTAILFFVSMLQKLFNFPKLRDLKGVVVEQPMPKLHFGNFFDGSFQQQTEKHLKQHFGYRPPLIRLYNQYLWDFYKKTPVGNGVLSFGKEGWIYEPWVVSDYYQNQYREHAPDAETMTSMLTKEAWRLFQVQHILESYGTHLFVSMVPAKDLIYPEHLPENKDTQFDNEPKISARFFNEAEYTRLGVNHLNLEQYFLQMKDTADFALFPQTGTHWSKYACLFAADTMIRYMEDLSGLNMENLVIGPRELDDARDPDDDLESLLNLMRPLPKPQYYYATVTAEPDSTAVKPKMITIGDSFWWNVVQQLPMQDIFSSYPYWYYNSTIYYDNNHHSVSDVDLVEELLSADFINLFYSATQLYRMNNEFTKKALMALCYDPEEIDSIHAHVEQKIRTDLAWMEKMRDRANSQNKPLDEVIFNEAQWVIDNNPERYFPELNDSIPTKRSKRVEAYISMDSLTFIEQAVEKIIQELKADETQMESIREKAVKNGKTFEKALRDDAHWIVNYKLEHGSLKYPTFKHSNSEHYGIQ